MKCAPGEEAGFAGLLGGEMDPRVASAFYARLRKSVLDIGTENGAALWYLYHRFQQMTEFHGVDKIAQPTSLFGLYQNWTRSGNREPDRVLTSKKDFDTRFNFRYGWDVCTEQIERTYDVVVASHVLHYLDYYDLEEVLKKIRSAMAKDALVYVSIKEMPVSGYGMFNSWPVCMDFMLAAAEEWGVNSHDLPEPQLARDFQKTLARELGVCRAGVW